eukprot:gnl/Chilomastix_cuspidata/6293.p1 GENE.gnl/Chilomastix_cuspidata/6293~~gnl/Chilomastix_cuspidata/6293.p1  ORF type:complete len:5265 (-),score=1091.15 gnl/Chilomastix_cuspidata/6293:310-13914(-)
MMSVIASTMPGALGGAENSKIIDEDLPNISQDKRLLSICPAAHVNSNEEPHPYSTLNLHRFPHHLPVYPLFQCRLELKLEGLFMVPSSEDFCRWMEDIIADFISAVSRVPKIRNFPQLNRYISHELSKSSRNRKTETVSEEMTNTGATPSAHHDALFKKTALRPDTDTDKLWSDIGMKRLILGDRRFIVIVRAIKSVIIESSKKIREYASGYKSFIEAIADVNSPVKQIREIEQKILRESFPSTEEFALLFKQMNEFIETFSHIPTVRTIGCFTVNSVHIAQILQKPLLAGAQILCTMVPMSIQRVAKIALDRATKHSENISLSPTTLEESHILFSFFDEAFSEIDSIDAQAKHAQELLNLSFVQHIEVKLPIQELVEESTAKVSDLKSTLHDYPDIRETIYHKMENHIYTKEIQLFFNIADTMAAILQPRVTSAEWEPDTIIEMLNVHSEKVSSYLKDSIWLQELWQRLLEQDTIGERCVRFSNMTISVLQTRQKIWNVVRLFKNLKMGLLRHPLVVLDRDQLHRTIDTIATTLEQIHISFNEEGRIVSTAQAEVSRAREEYRQRGANLGDKLLSLSTIDVCVEPLLVVKIRNEMQTFLDLVPVVDALSYSNFDAGFWDNIKIILEISQKKEIEEINVIRDLVAMELIEEYESEHPDAEADALAPEGAQGGKPLAPQPGVAMERRQSFQQVPKPRISRVPSRKLVSSGSMSLIPKKGKQSFLDKNISKNPFDATTISVMRLQFREAEKKKDILLEVTSNQKETHSLSQSLSKIQNDLASMSLTIEPFSFAVRPATTSAVSETRSQQSSRVTSSSHYATTRSRHLVISQHERLLDELDDIVLELASLQARNSSRIQKSQESLRSTAAQTRTSKLLANIVSSGEIFEQRVNNLSEQSRGLHSFLTTLINIQKQWISLSNVMQIPEVRRALGSHGREFNEIDRSYTQFLRNTIDAPELLPLSTKDPILNQLVHWQEQLENIQSGVCNHLEELRSTFPRFFLMSNDELISLLTLTSSSSEMRLYLPKLFFAIENLETNSVPSQSRREEPKIEATAIVSTDGERMELDQPFFIRGSSESWLLKLERRMVASVKLYFQKALISFKKMELEHWVEEFPTQPLLLTRAILWEQQVSSALADFAEASLFNASTKVTNEANSKKLQLVKTKSLEFLEKISEISSKTTNDSVLKTRLLNLITQEVYFRDVIEKLILCFSLRAKTALPTTSSKQLLSGEMLSQETSAPGSLISSSLDPIFEWNKTPRYNWDNETSSLTLAVAGALPQNHTFEYIGNVMRLVMTPLTERCQTSLLVAVSSNFGSSLSGPAGTGKTETIKDLARSLGRLCIVFNCSEELDAAALGRMVFGICETGAWGSFDEVNRINPAVLSVLAQMIGNIQNAMRAHFEEVQMSQKIIKLNPEHAFFITLNPGYSGRKEIPDSLSELFRPTSMILPDSFKIAEVILYALGFTHSKKISLQLVGLFGQLETQIEHLPHYDFGLRSVKAVLTAIENKKKRKAFAPDGGSTAPEEEEMRLVSDTILRINKPKFSSDDLKTFLRLLKAFFPLEKEAPWEKASSQIRKMLPYCIKITQEFFPKLFWIRVDNPDIRCTATFPMSPLVWGMAIRTYITRQFEAFASSLQPYPPRAASVEMAAGHLLNSVPASLTSFSLSENESQFEQVLHLETLLQVKQGVVVLGPAGSGKSTVWRLLAAAHELVGTSVSINVLFPRAMPYQDLFGCVDSSTLKWKDGILPSIFRNSRNNFFGTALKEEEAQQYITQSTTYDDANSFDFPERTVSYRYSESASELQSPGDISVEMQEPFELPEKLRMDWLVLDGPIDPKWAESLNTVLDDTKQLFLPNGERISLPPTLSIIMESDTLEMASPATVSRLGVVYISGTSFYTLWKSNSERTLQTLLLSNGESDPDPELVSIYERGMQLVSAILPPMLNLCSAFVAPDAPLPLPPSSSKEEKLLPQILFSEKMLLGAQKETSAILPEGANPMFVFEHLLTALVLSDTGLLFNIRAPPSKRTSSHEEMSESLCGHILMASLWAFGCFPENTRKMFQSIIYSVDSEYDLIDIALPNTDNIYDYYFSVSERSFCPWIEMCNMTGSLDKGFSADMNTPAVVLVPELISAEFIGRLALSVQCPFAISGPKDSGKTVILSRLFKNQCVEFDAEPVTQRSLERGESLVTFSLKTHSCTKFVDVTSNQPLWDNGTLLSGSFYLQRKNILRVLTVAMRTWKGGIWKPKKSNGSYTLAIDDLDSSRNNEMGVNETAEFLRSILTGNLFLREVDEIIEEGMPEISNVPNMSTTPVQRKITALKMLYSFTSPYSLDKNVSARLVGQSVIVHTGRVSVKPVLQNLFDIWDKKMGISVTSRNLIPGIIESVCSLENSPPAAPSYLNNSSFYSVRTVSRAFSRFARLPRLLSIVPKVLPQEEKELYDEPHLLLRTFTICLAEEVFPFLPPDFNSQKEFILALASRYQKFGKATFPGANFKKGMAVVPITRLGVYLSLEANSLNNFRDLVQQVKPPQLVLSPMGTSEELRNPSTNLSLCEISNDQKELAETTSGYRLLPSPCASETDVDQLNGIANIFRPRSERNEPLFWFPEARAMFNDLNKVLSMFHFPKDIFEDTQICKEKRFSQAAIQFSFPLLFVVGNPGLGSKTLTKMALRANSLRFVEFETAGSGIGMFNLWRDFLMSIYEAVALSPAPRVVLLHERHMQNPNIRKDIFEIIRNGANVAGLFANSPEQFEVIIEPLFKVASMLEIGTSSSELYNLLKRRVSRCVRFVVFLEPNGCLLDIQTEFPSLHSGAFRVNARPWPSSAFYDIAFSSFGALETWVQPLSGFSFDESLSGLFDYKGPQIPTAGGLAATVLKLFATANKKASFDFPPSVFMRFLQTFEQFTKMQVESIVREFQRLGNGIKQIRGSAKRIGELKAVLEQLAPQLEERMQVAEELHAKITKDENDAKEQKEIVSKKLSKIAVTEKDLGIEAAAAQRELSHAIPALRAAESSIRSLNKSDLTEIRTFNSPPTLVVQVMNAVCLVMGRDQSWGSARSLLGEPDFLRNIFKFDTDNIPPRVLSELRTHVAHPDFIPDKVSRVSNAATSLCMWARALVEYADAIEVVRPRKRRAAELKETLKKARGELDKVEAEMRRLMQSIQQLTKASDEIDQEIKLLQNKLKGTEKKYNSMTKLLSSLSVETQRWEDQFRASFEFVQSAVGSSLLLSSVISLLGPFPQAERAPLAATFMEIIRADDILISENLCAAKTSESLLRKIGTLLATDETLEYWNSLGLAPTPLSNLSMLMTALSGSAKLVLDPEKQASNFFKKVAKTKKLVWAKQNDSDLNKKFTVAVKTGVPLIIDRVSPEAIPAQIAAFYGKRIGVAADVYQLSATYKNMFKHFAVPLPDGTRATPAEGFSVILLCPRAAVSPTLMVSLLSKMSVVDFSVSRKSLESLCLVYASKSLLPDVEKMRRENISKLVKDREKLKQMENRVLELLDSASSSIFEDANLMFSLQSLQDSAVAIHGTVSEIEATNHALETIRGRLKPFARRGASVFLSVREILPVLSNVNAYGLPIFIKKFCSLAEDEKILLDTGDFRRLPADQEAAISETAARLRERVTADFVETIVLGLEEEFVAPFKLWLAKSIAEELLQADLIEVPLQKAPASGARLRPIPRIARAPSGWQLAPASRSASELVAEIYRALALSSSDPLPTSAVTSLEDAFSAALGKRVGKAAAEMASLLLAIPLPAGSKAVLGLTLDGLLSSAAPHAKLWAQIAAPPEASACGAGIRSLAGALLADVGERVHSLLLPHVALLLTSVLRPSALFDAADATIRDVVGSFEPLPITSENFLLKSSPSTPILIQSAGESTRQMVLRLAAALPVRPQVVFFNAMDCSQDAVLEQTRKAIITGKWIFLENPQFIPAFAEEVQSLALNSAAKGAARSEGANPLFRLIFSTGVSKALRGAFPRQLALPAAKFHLSTKPSFEVSFLSCVSASISFLQQMPTKTLPGEIGLFLASLCHFHSALLIRSALGAASLSVAYRFTSSDFEMALQLTMAEAVSAQRSGADADRAQLEERIRDLVTNTVYRGRVTNPSDEDILFALAEGVLTSSTGGDEFLRSPYAAAQAAGAAPIAALEAVRRAVRPLTQSELAEAIGCFTYAFQQRKEWRGRKVVRDLRRPFQQGKLGFAERRQLHLSARAALEGIKALVPKHTAPLAEPEGAPRTAAYVCAEHAEIARLLRKIRALSKLDVKKLCDQDLVRVASGRFPAEPPAPAFLPSGVRAAVELLLRKLRQIRSAVRRAGASPRPAALLPAMAADGAGGGGLAVPAAALLHPNRLLSVLRAEAAQRAGVSFEEVDLLFGFVPPGAADGAGAALGLLLRHGRAAPIRGLPGRAFLSLHDLDAEGVDLLPKRCFACACLAAALFGLGLQTPDRLVTLTRCAGRARELGARLLLGRGRCGGAAPLRICVALERGQLLRETLGLALEAAALLGLVVAQRDHALIQVDVLALKVGDLLLLRGDQLLLPERRAPRVRRQRARARGQGCI